MIKVIFLQHICPVTQKQKLKSKKKFKSETPSKMTQIIKRNYKKHDFSLLLQRTGNLH